MGVPQNRERVFFICFRKDLAEPFLENAGLFERNVKFNLEFNEKPILFNEIKTNYTDRKLTGKALQLWEKRRHGDANLGYPCMREENKSIFFSHSFIYDNKVSNTLVANDNSILFSEPRYRNKTEIVLCSSFPLDYNFLNQQPYYICGMSVPPLMIAKISNEVYKQFLNKL
jgi:DNA (cytosine-5)-methyltransferase 1